MSPKEKVVPQYHSEAVPAITARLLLAVELAPRELLWKESAARAMTYFARAGIGCKLFCGGLIGDIKHEAEPLKDLTFVCYRDAMLGMIS